MAVGHLKSIVKLHIGSMIVRGAIVAVAVGIALLAWAPEMGPRFDRYIFSVNGIFFWQRVLFGLAGPASNVIFALLIGALTALRFFNPGLGVVIGLAMVVNMVAAGTAGILIPLTLNRLKVDPAVASSVFVTTVTDVVGFFGFLGLAWLWMRAFGMMS